MSFSIPAPSSGVAVLASFGRSWHSHIPLGLLFNFQGTVRRSFTYSHRERSNAPPKREKYLRIKNSLHSFGQRVPKCTPIFEIFHENFYKILFCKDPLTYLELQGKMTSYFSEKSKNIFLPLQDDLFLLPKSPFTYLELEGQNAPYF